MGYQLDDDFNCQKVSEPADGVKSREGYVEWSVQEPQRIYSYRSASRKRSTLEDAAVEIMDTLHRYYTVYNRFVANPSNLHFKSSTRSQIRIRAKQPSLQTPIP